MSQSLRFAYFGGEPIGVPVLETLIAAELSPALVVTNPDRTAGRGYELTPPPVKVAALAHGIPVWQPENLKDEAVVRAQLAPYDLFVVVAYNRILPEWLINQPPHKTINLHPSLLPLRRGPNPIRSAIIEDDYASVGISVMLLDAEMDHGPILAQESLTLNDTNWPMSGHELEGRLATHGGELLTRTIPLWVNDNIRPIPQDHEKATYTKKITKGDGELAIDPFQLPRGEIARQLYLRILGLSGWPGTYFMYEGQRIKINDAEFANGELRIITVTPEGKRPQPFHQWLPSIKRK